MRVTSVLTLLLLTGLTHAWEPASGPMITEWGSRVTPDNAWQEYPRPMMRRDQWHNLNGLWNYAVTQKTQTAPPTAWDGKILVPFAIESALSGVKKRFTPDDALWYQRQLTLKPKKGKRTLLHFEAVDYASTVWINGKGIGQHRGGNLPFSFDIGDALISGENQLLVRVTDATDTAYQLHGKQSLKPRGIWYTPVSGIWQTVWTEEVPETHIRGLKITPQIDGTVQVKLEIVGPRDSTDTAKVTASFKGKQVAETIGTPEAITLMIPEPKLWSPDSPTLYDLKISFGEDTIKSYVGLRETTVQKGADGYLRFHLNGREIFQLGTLDQGWWPDGLLTPPSDVAMRSDVDFLKAAGFNMVRKHIKVEPRRYYHYCDKVGILVWQDQVSSGNGSSRGENDSSAPWTRLEANPVDAVWPDEAHQQYMQELEIMIDTLGNHPSIVQWVPFNEAWGQHRSMAVGEKAVALDQSRQINISSGGNFWPIGDVVDAHNYPNPTFPFEQGKDGRFDAYVKVVGEFGGHGYPVKGHLWNPDARNWGYGGIPKDKDEWLDRYKTSIRMLAELKAKGIAAGIYTQTTDVEGEINGLITYDRKVHKLTPEELAAIHLEAKLVE